MERRASPEVGRRACLQARLTDRRSSEAPSPWGATFVETLRVGTDCLRAAERIISSSRACEARDSSFHRDGRLIRLARVPLRSGPGSDSTWTCTDRRFLLYLEKSRGARLRQAFTRRFEMGPGRNLRQRRLYPQETDAHRRLARAEYQRRQGLWLGS